MADPPQLSLVESDDTGECVVCGEPATTRSAVDGQPLCLSCFTETHWHPSWQRSFRESEEG